MAQASTIAAHSLLRRKAHRSLRQSPCGIPRSALVWNAKRVVGLAGHLHPLDLRPSAECRRMCTVRSRTTSDPRFAPASRRPLPERESPACPPSRSRRWRKQFGAAQGPSARLRPAFVFTVSGRRDYDQQMTGAFESRHDGAIPGQRSNQRVVEQTERPAVLGRIQCHCPRQRWAKRSQRTSTSSSFPNTASSRPFAATTALQRCAFSIARTAGDVVGCASVIRRAIRGSDFDQERRVPEHRKRPRFGARQVHWHQAEALRDLASRGSSEPAVRSTCFTTSAANSSNVLHSTTATSTPARCACSRNSVTAGRR